MSMLTAGRAGGIAALGALALALAACSGADEEGGESPQESQDGTAQQSAQSAMLASYEGLDGQSYQMESHMTVNDFDFMDMTMQVEGDASHATQDIYMSAIIDAMGEDFSDDPETAAMMEQMFSDSSTETFVIDDMIYMQFSGGIFDAMAADFGEDAWFTIDLTASDEIGQVYEQVGSFDLREQTEMMLNELSDVEEIEDGVYTGTLKADADSMETLMGATGGTANGAEIIEDTKVTVTVGEDGLLESMTMTLPPIEGMTMEMTSEIVEIGGTYDITAPESDNLHSLDEFLAGAYQ